MGGRISDIAVHPSDRSIWYVAAGSGGVWKTDNAGVTWQPVFDDQPVYSIGCVTIDPNRPDSVWVGTGESVSGRHVAWGDGVYRSDNGGRTWTNTGLNASEHIGAIVVDPRDSNRVFVAAEGPLWSSGGERGVFRSIDRGATWEPVLTINDDTGVTSLVMAPDDSDVVIAASYQRRRHVASFVGGGAGSGLWKSTDGGSTWRRLTEGLPDSYMGKIGLAVTAADAGIVYATIEAGESERGFYRSTDRGESWERRNEYISGGTGPHYYQEIFASPVNADRVYQIDVFLQATSDGGKTFSIVETGTNKHSDNHVVWIDPSRPRHLLVGTDAGLYETFDDCQTFRHVSNLPISQFYRIAVDRTRPFAQLLAGAQDLGTLMGPVRTTNIDGVRNQDWTVPLGADGHHAAFHPTDPALAYVEFQQGNVYRLNRRSGELHGIQPHPRPNDPPERWNWDTPIVTSTHNPNRLFVASQRVWRSDDNGNSWTPISGDLTTNRNRYELPTFGTVPSIDGLYDNDAMSWFGTISHLCESPLVDGVIYVGTDDGRLHMTDDAGATWSPLSRPAGLPEDSYVNNLLASRHDPDVVYLAADNHKHGDYTPRLYRSGDRGQTWQLITAGLPDNTIVWAIEQDHIESNLLFIGTEFGLYMSIDGGDQWFPLRGGAPTISFRDVTIQRDDDDLIGATFGRGIYVLDDYQLLRNLCSDSHGSNDPTTDVTLFPIRDAWRYIPRLTAQAVGQPTLGATAYTADNPPFGALISIHLPMPFASRAERRKTSEAEAAKERSDIDVPSWDDLWSEHTGPAPELAVMIRDSRGKPVRRITVPTEEGFHRVAWDLRRSGPEPVTDDKPSFVAPWDLPMLGPLAPPGDYSAELVLVDEQGARSLSDPQPFRVVPLPGNDGPDESTVDFLDRTYTLARSVFGTQQSIDNAVQRTKLLRSTIVATAADDPLLATLNELKTELDSHRRMLVTDPVRSRLAEPQAPTPVSVLGRVIRSHWNTTQAPTQSEIVAVEQASETFDEVVEQVDGTLAAIEQLAESVRAVGGTWVP